MDLMRPASPQEAADLLAEATAARRGVVIAGSGRHRDRGPEPPPGATTLATSALNRVVSYDPAEMIAVVEAGLTVGELATVLAEGGQEWAADAPADATVGGVLAVALNSPRRLKVGPVRDSLLEVVLATGDGRLVRGGGRVVKNVTGYDLPRLAVGSRGTLGLIAQVALKVRPLPKAVRTLSWVSDDPFSVGRRILEGVPLPAAVVATPQRVILRLEGWPDEVAAQARTAAVVVGPPGDDDAWPPPGPRGSHRAEISVPPSQLADPGAGLDWAALLGVGVCWVGADDPTLLPPSPSAGLPAPEIHRRLKASFDPAGILPDLAGVPA